MYVGGFTACTLVKGKVVIFYVIIKSKIIVTTEHALLHTVQQVD